MKERLGKFVLLEETQRTALGVEYRAAKQLHGPNISTMLGVGKAGSPYYISYEPIEGKSLKLVLQRCRRDGFPFPVSHALLIASKICSALEHAHARKAKDGRRHLHGLLSPADVLVSYDGDVYVRGFGSFFPGLVTAGI